MTDIKRRRRAFLLAVAAAVVLLACVLYIFVESGHDCIGESCPVCAQLNVCRNLLRGSGMVAAMAALAGFCARGVCAAAYARRNAGFVPTLIGLKVKLSD